MRQKCQPMLIYGLQSFNTASGRYYCNMTTQVCFINVISVSVSIPQAVGTIAIIFFPLKDILKRGAVSIPQAVGTIAIGRQTVEKSS